MSGICGIVNPQGAAVDRELLGDLTAFMAFRGPDAQEVWIGDGVGFGHTMLRTTFESEHERQPCSHDGGVWITADARIDGRTELKERLAAQGFDRIGEVTDVDLILHAYRAWGEDCPKHLIGDFAFAIWDGPRKRLFCARDHFGVKPFFYALIGGTFVFSNTLECVRCHPSVSGALNDLAIADFLLFEMNQDPATTAFADIRRLAPAQCLTWSADGIRTSQYWTLPAYEEVRYRSAGDYVERFRELLGIAVSDRLRTRKVTLELSGGMDSTGIAATAADLRARQGVPLELRARTFVYERMIPDQERKFAALAAQALGIPIDYCVADGYRLFQFERERRFVPEPYHQPDRAASSHDYLIACSKNSRVSLSGWDGDALLSESPKPYFRMLWGERSLVALLRGVAGYAISERRLPHSVRAWLTQRPKAVLTPAYPDWLNPSLEARLELRDRWERVGSAVEASHSVRPYAHRIFSLLMRLSNFFDHYDAGVSGLPLECRHPLLDLRLLDYCLTLPPYPWCVKKKILREAMRGVLPEPVRLRPKTWLAGDPFEHLLRDPEAHWVEDFVPATDFCNYVDRKRIPRVRVGGCPEQAWANLRPLSLNFWLRGLPPSRAREKE